MAEASREHHQGQTERQGAGDNTTARADAPHADENEQCCSNLHRAKRSIDVPVFANGEPYEFHQQWSNDLNEFILVFGHDVDIDIPKQTIAT